MSNFLTKIFRNKMKNTTNTQPLPLYSLFLTEMWERFGFYGMRALLTLFMIKQFQYSDSQSYGIYGAYAALVYFAPIIGGLLADRLLGYRYAVVFGGILMALGNLLMVGTTEITTYSALAFIVVGTGFLKPNIASMVGGLYGEGDSRRDSGFTIFYVGINIGAFLGPLVCPWVRQEYGYSYAFAVAFFGMLLGISIFLIALKWLGTNGLPPDPQKLSEKLFGFLRIDWAIYLGAIFSIPLVISLLYYYQAADYILIPFGFMAFGYIFYTASQSDQEAKQKLFVVLVLMIFNTMFFAFFDLAPTALTIFAERNVDRVLFNFEIPSEALVALNPVFTMSLGFLFSQIWLFLAKRNQEPSTPMKFVFAFIFLGVGFFCFALGSLSLNQAGLVPLAYLVLGYLFHSLGELSLSPVGLSMITKLTPKTLTAMVIGSWYLCWSFSNLIARRLAGLTVVDKNLLPQETVGQYTEVFGGIGFVAILIAIILLFIVPTLRRWMHGIL